jgi:hypothetical protein
MTMPSRRFPPPWSVEELEACFVVRDASGQKLGYFYYEEEFGRRPSPSQRMRLDGSRPTWRSCRSYCGSPDS